MVWFFRNGRRQAERERRENLALWQQQWVKWEKENPFIFQQYIVYIYFKKWISGWDNSKNICINKWIRILYDYGISWKCDVEWKRSQGLLVRQMGPFTTLRSYCIRKDNRLHNSYSQSLQKCIIVFIFLFYRSPKSISVLLYIHYLHKGPLGGRENFGRICKGISGTSCGGIRKF